MKGFRVPKEPDTQKSLVILVGQDLTICLIIKYKLNGRNKHTNIYTHI